MSEQQHDHPNVYQAMSAVMADMRAVGKTGQNREQGYAFRSIDEFMNALHEPMSRHGVIVVPTVMERNVTERERRNGGVTRLVDLLVEFTFYGPNGDSVTARTVGEGADVADKASNKAMAAAFKYAIMQTFVVPTREMTDGDRETPDVPSATESRQARDEREREANTPPRADVLAALDHAADVLGKTRASLTEKWRKTHSIGPVAGLEDEQKVPTWALHQFVLTLQPFVQQKEAERAAAAKPDEAQPEAQQQEPPGWETPSHADGESS